MIIGKKQKMNKLVSFSGFLLNRFSFLREIFLKMNNSYRIVYYHIVTDEKKEYYFSNKTISIEEFKNQIDFFKKRFKMISLYEALLKHKEDESLAGNLSITTDDGFIENYTTIAPILINNGITATMFLISNCIDNNDLMWRNKLIYINHTCNAVEIHQETLKLCDEYHIDQLNKKENIISWSNRTWPMSKKELFINILWDNLIDQSLDEWLHKNNPYMNVEQIKELNNYGFNIGSHTKTHPICSKLSYKELFNEIIDSVDDIEKLTNIKPIFFSYPYNIRATKENEKRIIGDSNFLCLLGGKNRFNNFNPMKWERDLQEAKKYEREFRFYILPFIRKYFI